MTPNFRAHFVPKVVCACVRASRGAALRLGDCQAAFRVLGLGFRV